MTVVWPELFALALSTNRRAVHPSPENRTTMDMPAGVAPAGPSWTVVTCTQIRMNDHYHHEYTCRRFACWPPGFVLLLANIVMDCVEMLAGRLPAGFLNLTSNPSCPPQETSRSDGTPKTSWQGFRHDGVPFLLHGTLYHICLLVWNLLASTT